jgi:hypothetical protein
LIVSDCILAKGILKPNINEKGTPTKHTMEYNEMEQSEME